MYLPVPPSWVEVMKSLFYSKSFIVLSLKLKPLNHSNFCIWCKIKVHFHCFVCGNI